MFTNQRSVLLFYTQVHNVHFAFQLMQDSGLPKPKTRPEGRFPSKEVIYEDKYICFI